MYIVNKAIMLRIGGKAIRGIKGSRNAICENFRNIDVTSGSRAKIGKWSGRDFSPLVGNLKVFDDGREFQQFENWWQGNKVYGHMGHVKKRGKKYVLTDEFEKFQDKWAKQTKGKRVIPETKHNGKRQRPLFAVYNGNRYGYIDARWIYTSKYCEAVKQLPVFWELLDQIKSGDNIMLIDHDGPPSVDYPNGLSVTWDMLTEKLNDKFLPYGHGYILAAMLLSELD